MVTEYDEKGKIFTQVIAKERVQVIVQTIHNLIQGEIHIRQGKRIKDDLDEQGHFLAITDAIVSNLSNEEIYRTHFMVVNVDQIVWLIPEEEITR